MNGYLALIKEQRNENDNLQQEIKRLKHREKELKYFNDILEKQNIEKSKEIEILNTNWEVAKEDLTRIAQLLNLEEGCTIYDIEDKIERLNNIIKEIEKMFNHETLIKYYYGMSYEFEINDFKDDIFKIIKGSDKE